MHFGSLQEKVVRAVSRMLYITRDTARHDERRKRRKRDRDVRHDERNSRDMQLSMFVKCIKLRSP